ncbi:hypothetical protein QBC44DRAFT_367869 [Cladorrhinum sp. PSN332]|nr:hypothetical protein QBC44DRAFT_367869 [Cladorrhinum sp. PSN332]
MVPKHEASTNHPADQNNNVPNGTALPWDPSTEMALWDHQQLLTWGLSMLNDPLHRDACLARFPHMAQFAASPQAPGELNVSVTTVGKLMQLAAETIEKEKELKRKRELVDIGGDEADADMKVGHKDQHDSETEVADTSENGRKKRRRRDDQMNEEFRHNRQAARNAERVPGLVSTPITTPPADSPSPGPVPVACKNCKKGFIPGTPTAGPCTYHKGERGMTTIGRSMVSGDLVEVQKEVWLCCYQSIDAGGYVRAASHLAATSHTVSFITRSY